MREMPGIPVTEGARESWHMDAGDFSVSELFFGPNVRLAPHYHEPACISMLAGGAMEKGFGLRSYELPASSLITIPRGERHTDWFGLTGSRIVVVQFKSSITERLPVMEPSISLLDDILERRSQQIGGFANRLSRELRSPDDLSGLAVSGLVFELVSTIGRTSKTPVGTKRVQPAWLARVVDYLHANDDRTISIEDVAAEVGLHPGYLARTFREHVGKPLASYAREIRLERVANELSTTDDRILDIAIAAGFTDQSHLTRLFRRHYGVTPAQYRLAMK